METNYSNQIHQIVLLSSYVKIFVSLLNKTTSCTYGCSYDIRATCTSHLWPCFLTPPHAFSQSELRSYLVSCLLLDLCCRISRAARVTVGWSSGPFGDLPFHASANPPTWVSPHPSWTDTPKTQAAGVLVRAFGSLRFWASIPAWVLSWSRDSLSPSRRFVSPFGTGRVCQLQLLARVMPAGFQQLGGEVFLFYFLRAFWKCELAWFACRKVLPDRHQPFLLIALSLSWLVRIWHRCA